MRPVGEGAKRTIVGSDMRASCGLHRSVATAPQYGRSWRKSTGVLRDRDHISAAAAGIATSGLLDPRPQRGAGDLALPRPESPPRRRDPTPPPVIDRAARCAASRSFSRETLASIFALDYPDYEVLFCVADADDPIVPLVSGFIAAHPQIPARLLIGDDQVSANPKLNNVVKGWKAARHEWIVIADSNVLMPPRLYPAPAVALARRHRHRLLAADRLGAGGFRGRDRMRVPQHLSRRAGNMPASASATASPRARPCCGGAR